MPLIDDVLAWARTLPAWQQDALRRIFGSAALVESDFIDLLALLKSSHGIEGIDAPTAEPLSAQHVPSGSSARAVRLRAIRALTNVNAFPPGREITFAESGLTVVFGENGVGKSGYARVLKNACRARRADPVRPNVFETATAMRQVSAEFEVSADGSLRNPITWTQGVARDPDLATVSVFDSSCALDYIEEEGPFAFQPFGLAQVTRLARVCAELDRRIGLEISAIHLSTLPFQSLLGDSPVGRFISQLGHRSDVEVARTLAQLSEVELARLDDVTAALAESNPEPRAVTLERLAQRLDGLAALVSTAAAHVTDRAIERLQTLVRQQADALRAQELSQALLVGNVILPGTGNDAWRNMFEAVREFATTSTPQRIFPPTEADAVCELCQSPLTAESMARLLAFDEFTSSATSASLQRATVELENAVQRIGAVNFNFGVDETLRSEIRELAGGMDRQIDEWGLALARRRDWMLEAVRTGSWAGVPGLPAGDGLDSVIRVSGVSLRSQAQALRASADPVTRATLTREQRELSARKALGAHVDAIERYVQTARLKNGLQSCASALSTTPISRQITTFADVYITQALLDEMSAELRKLGYTRRIRQRVPRRTERGVTLVRMLLEGSAVQASEVLSEGEQSATALSFFLAEMRLGFPASTLVFDDPVTSLDHRYRRAVADRLVELASERQVVVFTHDAVFLTSIHRAAARFGSIPSYRTIEWDAAPGKVVEGLAWDHMDSGQRVNSLNQRLAQIRGIWGEVPSGEARAFMTAAYTELRGTIERIIRQDMLNSVIQPFSDEVLVENFGALVGVDQAEWDSMLDVYDRACEATRAHDTTGEHQIELPDPEQLRADIGVLEEARRLARARRTQANEARARRSTARRQNPAEASQS